MGIISIYKRAILLEASTKADPLLPDERRVYRALRPVFERYEPQIRRDITQANTPVYQGFGQDVQTAILPPLMQNYQERIQEFEQQTGYETDLDTEIPLDWTRSYEVKGWLSDAVQKIVQTTQDKVSKAAQVYVQARPGLERDGLLDRFLERILGRSRMEMIARTETTRARSQATRDFAAKLRQDGASVRMTWQRDRASNTCPLCMEKVGQDVEIVGYPPLHPRCACEVQITIQAEVTT
jgi:hypothetical protein